MNLRSITMVVGTLVLIASACGNDDGDPVGDPEDPASPLGRTFISESVTDEGQAWTLASDAPIRLTFSAEGDELRASAGCNSLFAGLTSLEGGVLSISDMGGTEMGCPPELHEQDQWLADLLTDDPEWNLDGDRLTITRGATIVSLLDRRVADPDQPLEGTRWEVDSIYEGSGPDGAVSSFPSTDAYLLFEDGSVTGFTGCNDLAGRYERDGSTLVFEAFVQTDLACDEPAMSGEEAVGVLSGSRVEVTIEASRLTLMGPDGGLGLRAPMASG